MAHMVETMFSRREVPWHGLGKITSNALTSQEALIESGQNWKVISQPMFLQDGSPVPDYRANVRDIDNKILGIVGNQYEILQNEDAFMFMDLLVAGGKAKYETAGSLDGGKRVWICVKLDQTDIVDSDVVENYAILYNGHDGKTACHALISPVRVVCQNTMNLALRNAKRTWRTTHRTSIKDKTQEVQEFLGLTQRYLIEFGNTCDKLASEKVDTEYVMNFMNFLYPLPTDEESERKTANRSKYVSDLQVRLYAPDLLSKPDTKLKLIHATTDHVTHMEPLRVTDTWHESLFGKILDGNTLIDKAMEYVVTR